MNKKDILVYLERHLDEGEYGIECTILGIKHLNKVIIEKLN